MHSVVPVEFSNSSSNIFNGSLFDRSCLTSSDHVSNLGLNGLNKAMFMSDLLQDLADKSICQL